MFCMLELIQICEWILCFFIDHQGIHTFSWSYKFHEQSLFTQLTNTKASALWQVLRGVVWSHGASGLPGYILLIETVFYCPLITCSFRIYFSGDMLSRQCGTPWLYPRGAPKIWNSIKGNQHYQHKCVTTHTHIYTFSNKLNVIKSLLGGRHLIRPSHLLTSVPKSSLCNKTKSS